MNLLCRNSRFEECRCFNVPPSCGPQGPGQRPAIFSHHRLVWELCKEVLLAAECRQSCSEPRSPSQAGSAADVSAAAGDATTSSPDAADRAFEHRNLHDGGPEPNGGVAAGRPGGTGTSASERGFRIDRFRSADDVAVITEQLRLCVQPELRSRAALRKAGVEEVRALCVCLFPRNDRPFGCAPCRPKALGEA
jgi:hypothetical protein